MSEMRSMPFWAKSSRRPTNGEINVAPAFAARRACPAEKHNVTFTMTLRSESVLHTFRPAGVRGTFTATFGAIFASFSPSFNIVSKSVEATSALTGPLTTLQISLIKGIKSLGLSNEILCEIKDQNTSTRKLSKISIGLLEELGYDVCYNEADNYEITEKVNIIKTLNIEINKNDEHTIDIYKIYIANTDNTKFNNYKLSEISNKYAIGDSKNNPYIIGYISGDFHNSYSNRTELLYLDRGITIKNTIDGSYNYYNSSLFTSNYTISYNYILNIQDNSYVINNKSYNNDSNNNYEISHNYYDNEISLNIIDLSNIFNFNNSSIDNSSIVQIFYVKDEFNNEISMNKYIKLTILPPYITLSGSPDASNIELYFTEYEPFVDYGHSIFDVIDGSLTKIQDVSLVIKNKNLNDNIKYNIKESELNGIDYRFITNNIGNYDILYKKSNSNNKEAKKHRDLKIVKTQPLEYITYLKVHDNNLFFDKNNDISNNLNKLDLSNILCYKYTINNEPYEYKYSDKYAHNNIYDISYIINLEKNYYYAFILPFDISNNININYSNNVELVTRQIYNIYDKKDTSCNLYRLLDNNGYITMKKINNFDLSLGMGWGRLGERAMFANPFGRINESFYERNKEQSGGVRGGEARSKTFFSGRNASLFGGLSYEIEKYNLKLNF